MISKINKDLIQLVLTEGSPANSQRVAGKKKNK